MHTHFINGQWLAGEGLDMLSTDPAKNRTIWTGITASPKQVDDAVIAARNAFIDWSFKVRVERLL